MSEEIHVPALARGLDLLEMIIDQQGISFNQLKEASGFNVATLSRTLNQLSAKGYIYKNGHRQYYAGYKLVSLDVKDSYIYQLKSRIMPELKKVSDACNLTLMLVLFSRDHMVVVDKVISENNLSMMNIGSIMRDYEHFFWGQFHLQAMNYPQRKKVLTQVKDLSDIYEVRPDDTMMIDYSLQAKKGYITDHGKIIRHATRFAVPLCDSNGSVIGAIAAGAFNECIRDVGSEMIRDSLMYLTTVLK